MQKIEKIIELAGHRKEDLSACLGCKICASVCTVNDLGIGTNPQELLVRLFLGQEVDREYPLVRYCTSCYRCTSACPWKIRIPEVVRALREELEIASPFEKGLQGILGHLGKGLRALCIPHVRALPAQRGVHQAYDEVDGVYERPSPP